MVDARFAKPLEPALIERLAREHEVLITIEEGSIGGFASQVLHHLAQRGLLDQGLKVRPMVLPDRFIDHDTPAQAIRAGRAQRQPDRPDRADRPRAQPLPLSARA